MKKYFISLFILFSAISVMAIDGFASSQAKNSERFVIAIGKIGEGPDMHESKIGNEIRSLLLRELNTKLPVFNTTKIDTILVERILNDDDIETIDKQHGVDLVVWGWIPIATPNAFVPEFRVIPKVKGFEMIRTKELCARICNADTFKLTQILSERISTLSMLLIGIILNSRKVITMGRDLIDRCQKSYIYL